MSAAARLVGFAAVLVALLAGGAVAGRLVDADAPGGAAAAERAGGHGTAPAEHAAAADPVRGLAVAEDGLRLALDTPELPRGRRVPLRLRILDDGGQAIRDFDVEHTKRLHLIVVRRDGTGFQHLHPTQRPHGGWSTPVTLGDAGSYRVFADFSHDGTATTLAADLRVDGPAELEALPAPARTATSDDGVEVELAPADARAGREARLRFTVRRNGAVVRPEPYLGAGGHLVALREGDLAFLHVHPAGTRDTAFVTTFPSEGRYRLFLQVRVGGEVHTVAFTREVGR